MRAQQIRNESILLSDFSLLPHRHFKSRILRIWPGNTKKFCMNAPLVCHPRPASQCPSSFRPSNALEFSRTLASAYRSPALPVSYGRLSATQGFRREALKLESLMFTHVVHRVNGPASEFLPRMYLQNPGIWAAFFECVAQLRRCEIRRCISVCTHLIAAPSVTPLLSGSKQRFPT